MAHRAARRAAAEKRPASRRGVGREASPRHGSRALARSRRGARSARSRRRARSCGVCSLPWSRRRPAAPRPPTRARTAATRRSTMPCPLAWTRIRIWFHSHVVTDPYGPCASPPGSLCVRSIEGRARACGVGAAQSRALSVLLVRVLFVPPRAVAALHARARNAAPWAAARPGTHTYLSQHTSLGGSPISRVPHRLAMRWM